MIHRLSRSDRTPRILSFFALSVSACTGGARGLEDARDAHAGPGDKDAPADSLSGTDAEARRDCGQFTSCTAGRVQNPETCECYPCESPQACRDGVCDLVTETCVTEQACTDHTSCGNRKFCNADQRCQWNFELGPCSKDQNCSVGRCLAGYCACTSIGYDVSRVAPNVVIVLDRSESMNEATGTDGTKWTVAANALRNLWSTHEDAVRFGLMPYPGTGGACTSGSSCTVGTVSVDPAPGNADALSSFLSAASTCQFGTPTAEALRALQAYAPLHDMTRENFVLLVTDGKSDCAAPAAEAAALLAGMPPIRTFVVGFGDAVDPSELTAIAVAGGTSQEGPAPYYQADAREELVHALDRVAQRAGSCTFRSPPSPSIVTPPTNAMMAYFNGVERVRHDPDHRDGWDYDGGELTFYGAPCDRVLAGEVQRVSVAADCPVGAP